MNLAAVPRLRTVFTCFIRTFPHARAGLHARREHARVYACARAHVRAHGHLGSFFFIQRKGLLLYGRRDGADSVMSDIAGNVCTFNVALGVRLFDGVWLVHQRV